MLRLGVREGAVGFGDMQREISPGHPSPLVPRSLVKPNPTVQSAAEHSCLVVPNGHVQQLGLRVVGRLVRLEAAEGASYQFCVVFVVTLGGWWWWW